MKLSEKRKQELYSAIHEPIISLRIELNTNNMNPSHDALRSIDDKLFKLTGEIWKDVQKVLKIED